MTKKQTAPAIALVERISKQIRPFLSGHPPEVQGAALAEVLSMFIAGLHPGLREEILAMHDAKVRELIPVSEKQIFPNGLPSEWL